MSMQPSGPYLKRLQCLGGLALLLSVGLSLAQSPLDFSDDDLKNEERKHRDVMRKLTKGEVPASANDKSHMDAIDYMGRLHTYRFTNPVYHKVPATDPNKSIDGLFKSFDGEIQSLTGGKDKDKTKEFSRLFALKVIEHGKKVLQTPIPSGGPLVQVNIARVLARTAALGQPETADVLVELVSGNYNDGAKYWALHGLKDLLSRTNNPAQLLQNPAREEKVAQALTGFIKRKVNIAAITPPDEIEGIRVLRREAVRALAQLRWLGKSGKDRPPQVLLEVLIGETLSPPPRIDERMEAALGLARLRPGQEKDYQPGYATQQIAMFLKDFAEYYSVKSKEEHRPTKVLAAQLQDAMEAMQKETNDPYVSALFGPTKPGSKLLEQIVLGQNADPSPVVSFAELNKPPVESLFKSMPDATAPAGKKQ